MTATNLIARTDAGVHKSSGLYGPGWHAPLPDVLKPGMSVKIGLKGNGIQEWPWATIRRVLGDKVWLTVQDGLIYSEDHGVESGSEIEAQREHLHLVANEERDRPHAVVLAEWEIAELNEQLVHFMKGCEVFRDAVARHVVLGKPPTMEQLEKWERGFTELSEAARYLSFKLFGGIVKKLKPLAKSA